MKLRLKTKGRINLNNAKKLLIYIAVLFFTFIFQIVIICHLSILDNRLDQKIVYANSEKHINIDDTTIHDEKINETDDNTIGIINKSEDTNNVQDEDDYQKYLTNSLFIGDSRTEGLRKFTPASQYSHFCCEVGISINDIINKDFYIGNDTTKLFDAISKNDYQRIFICIGYNELGWDYEDVFIEKYSALIDSIQAIKPSVKIYVQAVLNVSSTANVYNEYENNERINLYNSKIEEMCKTKNIPFINLNSNFTDKNGYLYDNSAEDGIHFTSEYYNIYLDKLILFLKNN